MKSFILRLENDLHKKLKHLATDADLSLHAYIIGVLESLDSFDQTPAKPKKRVSEKE